MKDYQITLSHDELSKLYRVVMTHYITTTDDDRAELETLLDRIEAAQPLAMEEVQFRVVTTLEDQP